MSAQTLEFKTEVKELLHLMIHSLYSHKEIFLRELISNASDAIDKIRYLSLTDSAILGTDSEWKIKLIVDKEKNSLTIRDNGIGMNEEEMIKSLGTIAHSGTKDFIRSMTEKQAKENPELIGQFGVGFYSAFMVAERVVVISRKAGDQKEKAIRWESKADGTFEIEPFEKDSRGTDVILFMAEEGKKYLDEFEIKSVVKKYSDYIEHAVYLDLGDPKKEDQLLNSQKAIWMKDKSEVKAEEYTEFYKHVSHDFGEPLKTIHFKAEGTSEFSGLLFIPKKAPFDLFYKEYKIGPKLYVKRVQIMDHCEELIPPYLRFVKGVVESADLPLNVSREILQANKQIEVIKKNIVKKVLDSLVDLKNHEYDQYLEFYKEFQRLLKEGLYTDHGRKDTIRDLLLFESVNTEKGKFTSLKNYVESMKPDQEFIYYMSGESREQLENSPYLEAVKGKDYDVLLLTDEIDEFVVHELEYNGKKLKSLTRGDIELDKDKKTEKKEAEKKYGKLIDLIKDTLKNDVKDVRISTRLKDSACCLVADEEGLDQNMERIMKAMGQAIPVGKRVLEINPDHLLIQSMLASFEENKDSSIFKDYSELLYDQALILEGSKPKEPVRFAKLMSEIMQKSINIG